MTTDKASLPSAPQQHGLALISARARGFQPKPFSERWMMRVFSATVRLGQSESSWNTQRTPCACAA